MDCRRVPGWLVLGDEEGIALIQTEKFESQLKSALEQSRKMVAED